jgi:signal transduction histidine kinase
VEQATLIPAESHFVSAESLRVRLDWFNRLRWTAGAGTLIAVAVARGLLGLPVPVAPVLTAVAILAVLNLAYITRNRRVPPGNIRAEMRLVKLQMVGDLVLLTAILNFTGGIENPLLYVYVIHVSIAALLFKGREIFQIAWLAIALFTAEVAGEHLGLLPHHHLLGAGDLTHQGPYVLASLAAFWLVMLFSAHLGSVIMGHNRAIKDELVRRQQQLIEADRAKMEFYRFVTHEVKSPVSTAQSAVETARELGGDELPDVVDDLLRRALGRLEQASAMVRNLADLTRSGLLAQADRGPVDLNALVGRAADEFGDLAARDGQSIVVAVPEAPLVIESSGPMLEKVVVNLLSNAVRYNRAGGTVRVTLAEAGDTVTLAVADEGIGIAAEDRQRIFDEFYRAPAAQARSDQGTGLGLPIVRRFVTDLGGAVTVDSRTGEGSVFTVTLPRTGAAVRDARQGSGS